MIDRKALLNDLKQQVKAVEADLGKQVKALDEVGARLRAEYDQARKLGRTAATWNSWLDERVTQVAVAWVLGTVFVRFCEDNRLIPEPYVTGPDNYRRDLAETRYDVYVEADDDPTYRGWLRRAFAELGDGQAGRLLFDSDHNPLYQIPLSHDGARELVEFWRQRDEEGALVHDFTDPLSADGTEGWGTRFLGDLYQDLSEAARKTYALLQTPEFVEEFILDRTMNPAVREFGYEELKMIDPTCGSGHFVLGAFRRLVRLGGENQPGKDVHQRVRAALDSVHGVDINPFAVAIARFRLLVAAMAASGVRTLDEASKYEWPVHLAVGDSLIKSGSQQGSLFGESDDDLTDELAEFKYATEDVGEHPEMLRPGRYHVVVGNPPYITVKDKSLNALYRELYPACAGKYALSVPFAQRFFELAKREDAEGSGYGMVGQITANSFMKREFGTKLIEGYFGHAVELTEVIDTSGAYIPGHGTPTVILVGTRRGGDGRSPVIRTVRSVQGEPVAPENAEEGLVWRAIVEQIDKPGSVSQWVSVDDLDREKYFSKQPWVLADGGQEMLEQINAASHAILKRDLHRIGFYGIMGADDAMSAVPRTFRRNNAESEYVRRLVVGDEVRDFRIADGDDAFHPYGSQRDLVGPDAFPNLAAWLWPYRTELGGRATFSGGTYFADGRPWWEWHQLPKDVGAHAWSLNFAFVATHNHVVLDRSGCAFTRTAPVIKLREGASEEEHLRLLGLLNSSTAGFWLKMVSYPKGGDPVGDEGARVSVHPWSDRYEFTGTKLQEFPLPSEYPTGLGTALDALAQRLAAASPAAVAAEAVPIAGLLREARTRWEAIRSRMIALQEEMDWQVYSLYKLHSEDLRVSEDPDDTNIPELTLGGRAFEIVLARRVAAGEASDEWFKRHNSTPITEIPAHWPAPYREIVQKRIDAIESNRAIGMVERPEYKRRWATEGWDALQEKALRSWLLDRMENRDLWCDENGQPTILTLARLTDALSRDEDFASVAKLYAPRKELAKVVAELITDEHVPFLSALRYKPSGLKKRADWEEVWDLQRKEDAAPDEPAKRKIRDSIPVPPKYTSADFLRPSYWKARGKLDVPKERFVSYGQTNAATPELYGWAGWDHREQAQALATYFTNTALSTKEITPFLAGLLELQPWLSQWHNEFDMLYSGSPADFFAGYRQQKQGEHGLTDDDLRGWRPPAATRRRRAAAKQ
ncbi:MULTISPECIES: BREX-2 system adenine-specific DNA-methyltransferase PglX [Streptomyces]|uniref:Adenine-specific methyltransferase PglX n=1 Tax=Streptomyces coelicolor (strain ATCC BAA-471 / A3(2) / M145) TaxID=100226 RepID=PGLX_STRCO|nr:MULTISPECIES: BREX-2 system adenine-specific DNA-methyltransferase PglX [Streptomyces]Q8CJM2.1 RecName: Full=Adenine-specific methyltransferase PglX; AltName: Full=Bacteriophage (PhiC31) resistance gene PglX; AltName: Full=Putative type II restriction enzyme and methyltransferase RM.ScoA3ORF6627P; Short=RM.ScoA3ORF6627P [Streptomyces coelicolor A3(2)]MYU46130.1 BREX-2 system adenine-specific DNA-methyltransferase PglX [Streptomyces sp. SID7813]MDX2923726.1 BREX-2 system adenine-specific DNA-m